MTGLFLSNYRIGTGAPGAFTLDLNMMVDAPQKNEIGTAKITQAVNPPLDLQTAVHGSYDKMGTQIVAYMKGDQLVAGAVEFQAALVVPEWGQPGYASYFWVDDKGQKHHIGPVPANPIKEQ